MSRMTTKARCRKLPHRVPHHRRLEQRARFTADELFRRRLAHGVGGMSPGWTALSLNGRESAVRVTSLGLATLSFGPHGWRTVERHHAEDVQRHHGDMQL